jgi:DNA-binding LytR/AlgR family response regulator
MNARLRALVVEDEHPARNFLVELLGSTGRVDVVGAVASLGSAMEALTDARGRGAIDVAFVDVHLGAEHDAGLRLVRDAANAPGAPSFVLATALDRHALEAYELGVVDYLLKPFTEERVAQCLDRIVARRPPAHTAPSRLVARSDKGLVFLQREEVWAFEASGRLTFVHTAAGRFDIDLSLAAVESSLGWGLLRSHRNWLVGLPHVRELVRTDGETKIFVGDGVGEQAHGVWVPVARERTNKVREVLLSEATGIRRRDS